MVFTTLVRFTQTHTLMAELPCTAPTTHEEQFGVQDLAQGHLDTQRGVPGFKPATF